MDIQCLAIYNQSIVAAGTLRDVIYKVKELDSEIEPMVFEQGNCRRLEFSWHGDAQTVLQNVTSGSTQDRKPGRPKLGVKAKEVTLLPRHWEWLATQRGGASATIRRLVDEAQREAQKNASTEDLICIEQQQLDKFMLTVLGDAVGFEAASRALYRNSKISFEAATDSWPADIKTFVMAKFKRIADMHSGEVSV